MQFVGDGIGMPAADLGSVLDPAQLNRIESVHRGFLYQHLYATACLLTMADSGAGTLISERDEDIELLLATRRLYLQVKTRGHALQWGDVKGAVESFAAIRAEHDAGRRAEEPVLVIVTNAEPGPGLAAKTADPHWPQDVHIHWPAGPGAVTGLPPAWTDLAEAMRWCVAAADRIPFASLASQTLVAKLAAHVQHLATGASGHRVSADELPTLCEQFVEQLQTFPVVPTPWFPHRNEPQPESEHRVRLLVGLAGSGKSTWAGRAAAHCFGTVVYFDIADLPAASVPASLARELAAHLLSTPERPVAGALLPGGSGLEILGAVNLRLETKELVTVVLDNVHRLAYADIRAVLDTASRLRFVLLAQPWGDQGLIEAHLGRPAESLWGWGRDTIAAVFASAGCPVDHPTAQRVLDLTGGLPLFVANAAQLTRDAYGSDARAFCTALQERLHISPTAQELLIGDTFARLGEPARTTAAVLALAEVPLTRSEADALGAAAGTASPTVRARALRELVACGLAQFFANGRVKLHDAARPVAGEYADALPSDRLDSVRQALAARLLESFEEDRDIRRFGRWLRLLVVLGQVDVLVDIAGDEHFREVGVPDELQEILAAVAVDEEQTTAHRFLASSALATWSNHQGDAEDFATHVDRMRLLATTGELDTWARITLALRLVLEAGSKGDSQALQLAHQEALLLAASPQVDRIVQYTYATGLYALGRYEKAGEEALSAAEAYYHHLGLTVENVVGMATAQLRAMVAVGDTWQDDCKHLADCLGLYVRTCRQRSQGYGLAALHAMKFYGLSAAWRSMVTIGQDAADDLVEVGNLTGALKLIDESLLPLTNHYALVDEVIGLRSQRAVIIAWLGDPDAALAQLDVLQQYGLTAEQSLDIRSQRRLVEAIAGGEVRLGDM
ncbi:hypothetical protein [Embleya sp. NPDC059237]|uniref:hypothetical protein n=1 Tax=Embleya sp. NPDC059237 TaxID=3346784 RepID=UPI0036B0C846